MDANAPPAALARRALAAGLVALLLALFVRTFVLQLVVVASGSMEPTLLEGDLVLVDRLAHVARGGLLVAGRAPRRGDVLLLRHSGAAVERWIKRCVAIAGDEVEVEGDRIWLGGRLVPAMADEPGPDVTGASRTWRLPPDSLFLVGDHRAASTDSRSFGPVPAASVLGRVVVVLWSRAPDDGIRWRRVALPVR